MKDSRARSKLLLPGPTLEEIQQWPATVDVTTAATAAGVSRAHFYEQIKLGTAPFRTLLVGKRIRVVTASILAALDGDSASAA